MAGFVSIPPVNIDTAATSAPSIPEPPSPTESVRSNNSTISILSIDKIESSFHELRDSFTFPPSLDFVATATQPDDAVQGADAVELAFTPTNAPLRAYEHALNGLLAQLDEVESEGDESVRGRRREVVREVEMELEKIDRRIREMKSGEVERRMATGEREVKKVKAEDERAEEVKAEVEGAEEVKEQVHVKGVEEIDVAKEVKEAEEAKKETAVEPVTVEVTQATSPSAAGESKELTVEPLSPSEPEKSQSTNATAALDNSDSATPSSTVTSHSTSPDVGSIGDVKYAAPYASSPQDVDISEFANEAHSDVKPSPMSASTLTTSTPSNVASPITPASTKCSPLSDELASSIPFVSSPSGMKTSKCLYEDEDAVFVYGKAKDGEVEGSSEKGPLVDEDEWTDVNA